jgi:catechol 2,3-dioxygenase-like lactoylglutathione lyase family enzyme
VSADLVREVGILAPGRYGSRALSLPREIQSLVRGVHHIAIVVESIAKARQVYEGVLGLRASEPEFVADQKVNADSPVSKFLATRGGGLHHVAYAVDDVAAAIAALEAAGLRLIDERPRPGAHGTRIAFVHPSATGGVLTELVEDRGAH